MVAGHLRVSISDQLIKCEPREPLNKSALTLRELEVFQTEHFRTRRASQEMSRPFQEA